MSQPPHMQLSGAFAGHDVPSAGGLAGHGSGPASAHPGGLQVAMPSAQRPPRHTREASVFIVAVQTP